jgi:hypothetical protein
MKKLVLTLSALAIAFGGASVAEDSAASKVVTAKFRQGVDGYRGTFDTEIWALATTTILSSNPNASSDANNDGGESQVLLRFDDIIGAKKGLIPKKARVRSAKLLVAAFDQGSTVNLHRMLVPFDEAATWGTMVSGVSADGLEASRHKDSFTFGKIAANSSEIIFDVTDTWVFINTGGNGWDFYTADFDKVEQRPQLVVEFEPRS